MRVVNPKITPRDMLNIISTLAQAQHGLGVQDKKSVWNISNFPVQNNTDEAGVPQVIELIELKHFNEQRNFSAPPPFQNGYLFMEWQNLLSTVWEF